MAPRRFGKRAHGSDEAPPVGSVSSPAVASQAATEARAAPDRPCDPARLGQFGRLLGLALGGEELCRSSPAPHRPKAPADRPCESPLGRFLGRDCTPRRESACPERPCESPLGRLLGLPSAGEAGTGRGSDRDGQANDEAEKPGIDALLQETPAEEYNDLWVRVLDEASSYLKPECLQPCESGAVDAIASNKVQAVASLLASFARSALDSLPGPLPPAFFEAACLCRDVLLHAGGYTQSLIMQAFDKIIAGGFEGREQFFGGVMMYMLGRCSECKASLSDVSQLYKKRALLAELDWAHGTIEPLKARILNCAVNNSFLLKQHGPDMLAVFYTVSPDFAMEVNSAVKSHAHQCKLSVSKAYSLALWKAVHLAEGDAVAEVERCVQEWVMLATRSNRKSAEKARAILEEIHKHHLQPLERELLCRCYGPVLWRALKVANWEVRDNAARILSLTFPLVSLELGNEAQELETMKQLRLVRETLEDPSEQVRRVGIRASCLIMKNYWDVIPQHEVAQLLAVLKDRCARDKKCPAVRAAVAEGFALVLQNPCTHPSMEAVLPEIGPSLLHDRVPMVRAAFVDLLHAVSECRVIDAQSVVSSDELYLCLVNQHSECQGEQLTKGAGFTMAKRGCIAGVASADDVAQGLAKLMAPSLFGVGVSEQVERCLEMLRTHPLVLLALLRNAGDVVKPGPRAKLAVALICQGRKELKQAIEEPAEDARIPLVTVLEVAGTLLESCVLAGQKPERLPEEFDKFLYTHTIKDEQFLEVLGADQGADPLVARLQSDLLFALGFLDAARLPGVADLVRSELRLTASGVSDAQTSSAARLMAFMRIASRWEIFSEAVEPTWKHLKDAASRFSAHHLAAENLMRHPAVKSLPNALSLADCVFREPEACKAVLPTNATAISELVRSFATAFSDAWLRGLSQPLKGTEQAMLGPVAKSWPELIGLVVRMSHHLQYRLLSNPVESSAAPEELEPLMKSRGLADEVLIQIHAALTSDQTLERLNRLESIAAANGSGPPTKRARNARDVALPSDIDLVLQIHERLLEALNASRFLQPLRTASETAADGDAAPSHVDTADVEKLQGLFWRWASVADELRPLQGGLRTADAWVSIGFLFLQRLRTSLSTPQLISEACRLFDRVTDDVPAEDVDMKTVARALLWQFEMRDDPQSNRFVRSLLGVTDPDGSQACADPDASEQAQANARVAACIRDILPTFRRLHSKLIPGGRVHVNCPHEFFHKSVNMKSSDCRYTPPEAWAEFERLTGVEWESAVDACPMNFNVDMLLTEWKAPRYYCNPPFSMSRHFVKKILDELDAGRPQEVLLLVPWYQWEDVEHRVSSLHKWAREAQLRMKPYLKSTHSMFVKFLHPEGWQFKRPYHVYISHLRRTASGAAP